MNSLYMLKAGIHPLQLNEGIIDFFKKGLSALADILSQPYKILSNWKRGGGTIAALGKGLDDLANSLGVLVEAYTKEDLKSIGHQMAMLLSEQKFLIEGDEEKEMAFYMFLDSMGVTALVEFLKRALPPDLSDNDIKQAGYWMLKTIVKNIQKRPQDMKVAAYISGTEAKDVKSIFDVFGLAVYTEQDVHTKTSRLSELRVTAGQTYKTERDYDKFLWIQELPTPAAFWLVLDKDYRLSYIVKNPQESSLNGKVYKTLESLCKLVDKRRYRKFSLVYNTLCFEKSSYVEDGIKFAIANDRLPQNRKMWSKEHVIEASDIKMDGEMREGRDCLGTARGYKNTDFVGFFRVEDDDTFEIGVF